jgi:hypothetical protein
MAFLRMSGLALAAVLGLSLPIGQATAMPANGLAVAVKQVPKRVEDVRLVCGPYRCWSTGWGWRRPLYAYAGPGWGWRRPFYGYGGWGWRRPLYAYAGPGWGWRRPLYGYGWGWRRPLYAAAVTTGVGFNPWYGGWNPGYAGGPYYAYAGLNTWRGWGWSNTWW